MQLTNGRMQCGLEGMVGGLIMVALVLDAHPGKGAEELAGTWTPLAWQVGLQIWVARCVVCDKMAICLFHIFVGLVSGSRFMSSMSVMTAAPLVF